MILDMKTMLSDEDHIEPTIQVLKDCFEIDEQEVRDPDGGKAGQQVQYPEKRRRL